VGRFRSIPGKQTNWEKREMRVRIESIERLTNSYNGNPRFRIGWSEPGWSGHGHANTASDASYNYEIGNKGLRVLDVVEIELNGRGTIKSIERAS
jgi:hypothetical protein